ncbi:MAG: L,D-transpeptidase family protein [Pseudomonadota bacterium]
MTDANLSHRRRFYNRTSCYRLLALVLCLGTTLSASLAYGTEKASRILVDKSERTLVLFSSGKPIKSYPVSLGRNPVGHKRYEGDKRTPEGIYIIDGKNPNSAFHLSLHISYPNERDKRIARERGWDPGGAIVIHGLPTGLIKTSAKYEKDWTDGCIALSNAHIEEIWGLVDEGTLIEITP